MKVTYWHLQEVLKELKEQSPEGDAPVIDALLETLRLQRKMGQFYDSDTILEFI